MKKRIEVSKQQTVHQKTISTQEFFKDFTDEQKKVVRDEIRYYDVLQELKQTRKKMGLTQDEIAQRANLPRTTISKIEAGKHNPTLSTLMCIASALNKTLQIQLV